MGRPGPIVQMRELRPGELELEFLAVWYDFRAWATPFHLSPWEEK